MTSHIQSNPARIQAMVLTLLLGASGAWLQAADATPSRETATNAAPKPATSPAPEGRKQNGPMTLDFGAFRAIQQRNIFDPNRRKRAPAETERAKPAVVESFSLVGTMSYEKGLVAFFDSSASAFRKVARVKETIAGYTIKGITAKGVELEADGKPLELTVGAQLSRRDKGPWEVRASGSGSTNGGSASKNSSSPVESEPGADEAVAMRLLEKRGQEVDAGAAPGAAEAPAPAEKAAASEESDPGDDGDEVLKRLREKRQKEINK